MRAWKVFEVEGKPVQLEIKLNQIQQDGFNVLSVAPKSFGFLVIAFMDQSSSAPGLGAH
jgi:hypothetical protein